MLTQIQIVIVIRKSSIKYSFKYLKNKNINNHPICFKQTKNPPPPH